MIQDSYWGCGLDLGQLDLPKHVRFSTFFYIGFIPESQSETFRSLDIAQTKNNIGGMMLYMEHNATNFFYLMNYFSQNCNCHVKYCPRNYKYCTLSYQQRIWNYFGKITCHITKLGKILVTLKFGGKTCHVKTLR